jgi:hypothetical protein
LYDLCSPKQRRRSPSPEPVHATMLPRRPWPKENAEPVTRSPQRAGDGSRGAGHLRYA